MMRSRYTWKLSARALELGERTRIMGIVNVTPDSFSDGGEFFHSDLAVEHALQLLEEGADIVDIGGESTRPGRKERVSALEESRRVIPVIKGVLRALPSAVLSIDTYKSEVAERAIDAGAEIVNDVSGFNWDPALAQVAGRLGCGCVLMHSRGRPQEWPHLAPLAGRDLRELVKRELAASALKALSGGVAKEAIVVDPGIGFGKRFDENYLLLAHLGELGELGFPLLAGPSRKSFIARTVGSTRSGNTAEPVTVPVAERLNGTLAASVAAVLKGAHIIRVHDVRPAIEALAIADAVLRAEAG